MNLPDTFIEQMKKLLMEEYPAFIASYNESRHYGLRLNALKGGRHLEGKLPFEVKQVPWCTAGKYFDEDQRPAKDPYYAAGSYYIQEPSAMTPGTAMGVEEGDLVIDLCAAPGGKTTQMASDLMNRGLIVTNDISPSRVKNLNKNVQISGVRNALVLSEDPVRLAERWPGVADRVLVDAPCSGEGMFRKEPKLVGSWESNGPASFVEVQRSLLESAHSLLVDGGVLVYSTCTYNTKENEENIQWFLDNHPDYIIEPIGEALNVSSGISVGGDERLEACARVWPHRHQGEGHFIAKLIKGQVKPGKKTSGGRADIDKESKETVLKFLEEVGLSLDILPIDRLNRVKDTIYLLPEIILDTKGLRVFANGWLLGTMRKGRFEPSQAFASGLTLDEVKFAVDFQHDGQEVIRYLKGETVATEAANGWHLVTVEGQGIGWGKVVNKRLKNKLEPSWRWM